MKIYIFISLFISSLFAEIGLTTILFEDNDRNRELNTYILYPTMENEGFNTFAENPVFHGFNAIEESEIKDNKYPLFILLHGTNGNWRNLSWLGKELAKKAIVLSTSHPDYSSGQATPKKLIRPWNQAKDVSFLINEIKKSDFSENLNGKIYVIGHSLGGYSALALSGAKIDLKKFKSFCVNNKSESCKYLENEIKNLTNKDLKDGLQDLRDNRISKSISLTPSLIELMTSDSLKSIKTKTLILTAQFDKNVPSKTHIDPYKKNFSNFVNIKMIEAAGHFSFLQNCKKDAYKILKNENSTFVCEDSNTTKTRKEIHLDILKTINKFIEE